jgi:hypothetical protein
MASAPSAAQTQKRPAARRRAWHKRHQLHRHKNDLRQGAGKASAPSAARTQEKTCGKAQGMASAPSAAHTPGPCGLVGSTTICRPSPSRCHFHLVCLTKQPAHTTWQVEGRTSSRWRPGQPVWDLTMAGRGVRLRVTGTAAAKHNALLEGMAR